MSLQDGGKVVTVGLGVCDGKWVGLFDIVTDERYRRQGFGRAMVENLLAWGRMNGAQRAYLQVHRQNDPALALYDKIGFREVYRYWYRQKL